jgi:hypothetical protein
MSSKLWFFVVAAIAVSVAALSFVLWEAREKPSGLARASDARAQESGDAAVGRQRLRRQRTTTASSDPRLLSARETDVEVAAEPGGAPPPAARPTEEDRTEVLAAALDAEYAVDAPPTQEALRKESVIKTLFAGLNGSGQLQEVACRERVCRGVVRVANESADSEVFSRTFLSSDFVRDIQDAVSVTSRQKLPDGAVLATFFIHPQSAFDVVATDPSDSGE